GQRELHSDQEKREVRFLESAYEAGYQPFEMGPGSYGATGAQGRGGGILWRGRNRWEIAVHEANERAVDAFVDDFECAACAVLEWLGGAGEDDIAARIERHAVMMPGSQAEEKIRINKARSGMPQTPAKR
ncbi:MAG TPA: hypothetical protein PK867_08160, partial [Pirellulales bacterium]|nr:hypothetical protein [Pirellulales bacterium]